MFRAAIIFSFYTHIIIKVELCMAQSSLELLDSSDPSASAGTIGAHHCAQLEIYVLKIVFYQLNVKYFKQMFILLKLNNLL
jgi:hypothetical protein